MDRYGLADHYATNLDADGQPFVYEDSPRDAATTQVAVYRHAARLVRQHGFKSVIDLGCGLGIKLNKYIAPLTFDITGVDEPRCINHCRQAYLFGQWITDDIECPTRRLERNFDLILAANVIEHLLDPEKLIDYARGLAHKDTLFLISTPDREKMYPAGAKEQSGPPRNRTHVREWTAAELKSYLERQKLEIADQRWVESRRPSSLLARLIGTQGPAETVLFTVKFKDLPPPK